MVGLTVPFSLLAYWSSSFLTSSLPASAVFQTSSSAQSLSSSVMVRKMTGMVDWLQDDENSSTIVYLQALTSIGQCGVIGCRQGGRESHRLLCIDGV